MHCQHDHMCLDRIGSVHVTACYEVLINVHEYFLENNISSDSATKSLQTYYYMNSALYMYHHMCKKIYIFLCKNLHYCILFQVNKIFFLQSQEIIGESPDLSHSRLATSTKTVDKRLLAIPILYIILRMWGTLQFFYSLAVAGTQNQQPGCIPQMVQVGYFIFGLLQV